MVDVLEAEDAEDLRLSFFLSSLVPVTALPAIIIMPGMGGGGGGGSGMLLLGCAAPDLRLGASGMSEDVLAATVR